MTVVQVRRVLSSAEADELVGRPVEEGGELLADASPDDPLTVVDEGTGETVAIVTVLPDERRVALRRAVLGISNWTGVGRLTQKAGLKGTLLLTGSARTFGYTPRKVMGGREACHEAALHREFPDTDAELSTLASFLSAQFAEMMPERAVEDHDAVHAVRDDWFLNDKSLWTSGVINRTSVLPYHRDGANFHTWSAMPSLRYGMRGGRLRVPEYGLAFPVRDGEVTWFCGRDLVHGVTPMTPSREGGYRYTVVFYALRLLKDCRTYAEETVLALERRTARERRMASELP